MTLAASLVGTTVVLVGVGLLSVVPDERAGQVFAYPLLGGAGLVVIAAGIASAVGVWHRRR